jgi:signal transduction histidine kinase
MSGEVRDRLFEAFFTTKGATGTGLGLWVSHEIILKHHGIVHVRSRQGAGTVFQIFFPDDEELMLGVMAQAEAEAAAGA